MAAAGVDEAQRVLAWMHPGVEEGGEEEGSGEGSPNIEHLIPASAEQAPPQSHPV